MTEIRKNIIKKLATLISFIGIFLAAQYIFAWTNPTQNPPGGNSPGLLPAGSVIMWSGTIVSIPTGWRLCDGGLGTPNLLDKFVLDVSSSGENPGATGGANSYSLSASQLPPHSHGFTTNSTGSHTHGGSTSSDGSHSHAVGGTANWSIGLGGGFGWGPPAMTGYSSQESAAAGTHSHSLSVSAAGDHTHSGSTDNGPGSSAAIDNRPAYYKLAFICKI